MLTAGALRPVDARPLLEEAGELLQRLHAVPTTGYGRIDAQGVGPRTDPRFALTETMEHGAHTLGLAAADIARAARLLEQEQPLQQAGPPRLLHGDLSPQQIMVDAGRVSGFIDFEFPESGDPAREFAYWDYYQRERLPASWLLDGYGQDPDAACARRIPLHRLWLGFDLAAYHGTQPGQDPTFLDYIRACFLRDLAACLG